MGLSNEERYLKIYNNIVYFRIELETLKLSLINSYSNKKENNKTAIVDSWIAKIDFITGQLIKEQDNSSALWILGRNNNDFSSIYSRDYDLGRSISDENSDEEGKDTANYVASNTSLSNLANFWCSNCSSHFHSNPRGIQLAHFWEAHGRIASFLYPIYRYDDDMILPKISDQLITLFGEMTNRRFELISPYVSGYVNHIHQDMAFEQALLVKGKLFFKELELLPFNSKVDKKNLMMTIAKMTPWDIKKRFEEIWQIENTNRKQGTSTETVEKIDAITGPTPRKAKDLEKIIFEIGSFEEAKIASEELSAVYSCYVGGWEERFKIKDSSSVKKKSKKVKV